MAGSQPPYYLHRTHPWIWLCLMSVASLGMLAAVAFASLQAARGRIGIAEAALGLFAVGFLVLLCRPATWQAPIAMIADRRGLHFLHGQKSTHAHSLPWDDVGGISVERYSTGNGVTRTVVVRVRADARFWSPAVESPYMSALLQNAGADGYRKLPLPPVWRDAEEARVALEYLRSTSVVRSQVGLDGGHPH